MTARARVVRGADAARAEPLLAPEVSPGSRRRIVREELAGRLTGERLVEDARAKADRIIADAFARSADAVTAAVDEATRAAATDLAARWLALRQAEHEHTARDADRIVPMAIALAERLLGSALELDPPKILSLARVVIDEVRGARRARIDAHPADAEELTGALTSGGLDVQSIEVRADATLARGELRLHTDVGTIDARLAPRFERLAVALRNALDPARRVPG